MEIVPLLVESGAPSDVLTLVGELVELKARTREMGVGVAPPRLLGYVEETLALGESLFAHPDEPDVEARRALAAEFFRHTVRTYGPS